MNKELFLELIKINRKTNERMTTLHAVIDDLEETQDEILDVIYKSFGNGCDKDVFYDVIIQGDDEEVLHMYDQVN